MRCRKARKLIFDFIDGRLSDRDEIRLESHLVECHSCEKLAAHMRKSLDLLHSLPEVTPSDNFNWKVRLKLARERNSIHEKLESQSMWMKRWNTRFALGTVAAFTAVTLAGYLFLNSRPALKGTNSSDGYTPKSASVSDQRPTSFETASRPYSGGITTGSSIAERFVSAGYPTTGSASTFYQPIEEDASPNVLGPDSLVTAKLKDMRMRYRVRYLERQIDLLQGYLHECQQQQRQR
jgi:hypothetical protein